MASSADEINGMYRCGQPLRKDAGNAGYDIAADCGAIASDCRVDNGDHPTTYKHKCGCQYNPVHSNSGGFVFGEKGECANKSHAMHREL